MFYFTYPDTQVAVRTNSNLYSYIDYATYKAFDNDRQANTLIVF